MCLLWLLLFLLVSAQCQTLFDKFSLELKPPNERELFVNDKVVLEVVVSGDKCQSAEKASVACKVKNESVSGNIHFSQDTSPFIRVKNVTVDANKWFDGEPVTCTIHDPNNNRDFQWEIRFDKGDGQKPSVFIYKPDFIDTDQTRVSLVCEVTSPKLGNVYIMWKVDNEPYRKGLTSAPIHQPNSTSVLSILTLSKQEYAKFNIITCAVIHANMNNRRAPLQVSAFQSKQPELSCD
ncbi:uncharacterized protein LOC109065776 [Cyprinus carpio]|uniref:Uncharacterized protein LOC109065776 n=1 Tax=Cyprinus carpio TaxID=7962 RepID=A0A9Q9WW21_CYPCA|nr:uncharacterized protein LOC109065776 [Cyprinus carpio]